MSTDPSTQETAQAIFRHALAQNQAIHAKALADLQQRTSEVHEHMRNMTLQYMSRTNLPDFSTVRSAADLDPTFWPATVERAKDVLRAHGILPSEEPQDGTPEA